MAFPVGWPDFTKGQRQRLVRLGVSAQQVEQLRFALMDVKRVLFKPAGGNEVKAVLADIADQAEELTKKLTRATLQVEAAHAEAMARIEERWWEIRRANAQDKARAILKSGTGDPDSRADAAINALHGDDGQTSMHHLIPRLTALVDAARSGIDNIGSKPRRHRVADPLPVRAINDALLRGWSHEHGPPVRAGDGYGTVPRTNPYPRELRPSSKEGSAFREIVRICYEAAGAPTEHDRLRAIEAFLQFRRKQQDELAAVLWPNMPRKKNRTSKN